MSPDTLIVGGGAVGLMTARTLVAEGQRTTVVERARPRDSASWAGGGILGPLPPWEAPEAVRRLSDWSVGRYPDICAALAEETGVDPEWTRSGVLLMDADPDAASAARAVGVRTESLDELGLRSLAPALAPGIGGALHLPDMAQLRNPRLLRALRSWATNSPAVEWVEADVAEVAADGAVGLDDGTSLIADRVVVAAGAWSTALLEPLGCHLPLEPVRGQMLRYDAPSVALEPMVLVGDRYLIPRRDGGLVVGSSLEHVGFDPSTTPDTLADLERFAVGLLPELAGRPPSHSWAGLRPGSPDGIPWIGPLPAAPKVLVATGHYRLGLTTAPATARLVTDLILGCEPEIPAAAYALPG